MSIFSDLFSIDGKLHILSILITVVILTIFELVFFYVVIIPQVNDLLDSKYTLIEENVLALAEEKKIEFLNTIDVPSMEIFKYVDIEINVDEDIDNIDKSIQNVFKVLIDREQKIIEQNNTNTIITGITIVLFLMCFLLFTIISVIKNLGHNQSYKLIGSFLTGGIIVICLISFQILFYNFSNNYNYTTNNELIKLIINNLNLD